MIIRYFAHFLPSPQLLFSLLYIMLLLLLSLQSCPTLCDPRRQPTRLPRPWDSPGKNTGVGCLFLLQCMKVKSESESEVVSDSSRPHGLQPTRLLRHGTFQARTLAWGAIAFSTVYHALCQALSVLADFILQQFSLSKQRDKIFLS